MYFRGPQGRLVLPKELPSLKKANLLLLTYFFPIVKITANYADICRVGNLEADFQQIPLVHFFF